MHFTKKCYALYGRITIYVRIIVFSHILFLSNDSKYVGDVNYINIHDSMTAAFKLVRI